jgi:hypothetical protein
MWRRLASWIDTGVSPGPLPRASFPASERRAEGEDLGRRGQGGAGAWWHPASPLEPGSVRPAEGTCFGYDRFMAATAELARNNSKLLGLRAQARVLARALRLSPAESARLASLGAQARRGRGPERRGASAAPSNPSRMRAPPARAADRVADPPRAKDRAGGSSGAGRGGAGREALDYAGAALAVGDFNGDGQADVAAGAPGAGRGAQLQGGRVTVSYGGAALPEGECGPAGLRARLGWALAALDLNLDGFDDLAAGAPSGGAAPARAPPSPPFWPSAPHTARPCCHYCPCTLTTDARRSS